MMANEFVIELSDRPGELAKVCDMIGGKGINLKAITTDRNGKQTFIRLLADKDEELRKLLEEKSYMYSENKVLIKTIEDKPGSLTTATRKLGAGGVNIEALYLLNRGQDRVNIVFALDNPKKGADILKD